MSKAKATGRAATSGRFVEIPGATPKRISLFERMTSSGIVKTRLPASKLVGKAAFHQVAISTGKTRKLSVRVPQELIDQAMETSGISKEADLIKAGLAALAAPNAFGAWLIANEGSLPEDFELDV